MLSPVCAQLLEEALAERHLAHLRALAADAQQAPLAVDVADLELARLADAQPALITSTARNGSTQMRAAFD